MNPQDEKKLRAVVTCGPCLALIFEEVIRIKYPVDNVLEGTFAIHCKTTDEKIEVGVHALLTINAVANAPYIKPKVWNVPANLSHMEFFEWLNQIPELKVTAQAVAQA